MTQTSKFRSYCTLEIINHIDNKKYQISPGHTFGTICILNEEGEGAELPLDKFFRLLDVFFKENF